MKHAVSWLHFADLNLGPSPRAYMWSGVRERLNEDLERLHERCGPWDFVFLTGELTSDGSHAGFAQVDRWLDELLPKLAELGSTPTVLAVPGGRDLERGTGPEVLLLRDWWKHTEARDELWSNADSSIHQTVADAFARYHEWSNTHRPAAGFHPGLLRGDFLFTKAVNGGIRVGVLGLNSAAVELGGDDPRGRLDVDVRQFHGPCGGSGPKWAAGNHVNVVLTHRPTQWLHPSARRIFTSEIAPMRWFTLALNGHSARNESIELIHNGRVVQRELAVGPLFGARDGARYHAYMAGRVELVEDGSLALRLWPRVASQSPDDWDMIPDHGEFPLEDDGGTPAIRVEPMSPIELAPPEPESEPAPKARPVNARAPRWVWYSTPQMLRVVGLRVDANEREGITQLERAPVSVLAILETIAATALTVLLAAYLPKLLWPYILVAGMCAPLVLLQTPRSRSRGLWILRLLGAQLEKPAVLIPVLIVVAGALMGLAWLWFIATSDTKFTNFLFVLSAILLVTPAVLTVLTGLAARVAATVYELVTNPARCLDSVPHNLRRYTLHLDSAYPPELVPGLELLALDNDEYKHYRARTLFTAKSEAPPQLLHRIRKAMRGGDTTFEPALSWIITLIPALWWRWSVKATVLGWGALTLANWRLSSEAPIRRMYLLARHYATAIPQLVYAGITVAWPIVLIALYNAQRGLKSWLAANPDNVLARLVGRHEATWLHVDELPLWTLCQAIVGLLFIITWLRAHVLTTGIKQDWIAPGTRYAEPPFAPGGIRDRLFRASTVLRQVIGAAGGVFFVLQLWYTTQVPSITSPFQ